MHRCKSWISIALGAAGGVVSAGTWALLAASLTWSLAAVCLPWLHAPLAHQIAHDISARQAWWATGGGLVASAGALGIVVGLITGLSAFASRARARPWLAAIAMTTIALQVPWLAVARIGVDLSDGQTPHLQHAKHLLPGGPFPGARARPVLRHVAPVVWPVSDRARVTSHFGWRWHPTLGGRRFHNGVDVAVRLGTPVASAADGTVQRAGEDDLNGRHVVLVHADGMRTAYCHLDALTVHTGEAVQAGDRIGLSGATGRASGPHLHFSVWVHGQVVDPMRLARRTVPKSTL